MRQALNRSVFVLAAASGILTTVGGHAYADATADGAAVGSPGVGSGNVVQAPVHVPVNACGNTVDVIALLNPAFGNTCANVSSDDKHDDKHGDENSYEHSDAYGNGSQTSSTGADAEGKAVGSPGVLSGNLAQIPVEIQANACGNTVDIVGALNPAGGNTCVNDSGDEHPPVEPPVEEPPTVEPPTEEPPTSKPPVQPPAEEPPAGNPGPNTPDTQLAQTGAGDIGMAAGASAALLLGGAVLLRRTRGSRN